MKNRMFVILIIILFIIGSSYRFIQLNKNISNEIKYEEVENNEHFNLNGVKFKLVKSEYIDNSILTVDIELNKEGQIDENIFEEPFPSYYDELISLNITDKDENLVGNYTSDIDMYYSDNKKFMEIKDGKRSLGENTENLILKFVLNGETIEKINNSNYNVKLVFPCDSYNNKSKFIIIE
ncbi:MAG: hypothetical protein RSF67_04820 [Clostridia bacterium]